MAKTISNDNRTWPENAQERSDFSDWQYEVANSDTVLGFRDWIAHRNERSSDEITEDQGRNTTTNNPEYLFAVKDQENKSISWTRPEEINKLVDDSHEDPLAIDTMLAIVIIDAAYWDAEGFWNDADPFEEISDQFGLSGITECVYEPYGTATFSSALAQLLADPRFQRNDSI